MFSGGVGSEWGVGAVAGSGEKKPLRRLNSSSAAVTLGGSAARDSGQQHDNELRYSASLQHDTSSPAAEGSILRYTPPYDATAARLLLQQHSSPLHATPPPQQPPPSSVLMPPQANPAMLTSAVRQQQQQYLQQQQSFVPWDYASQQPPAQQQPQQKLDVVSDVYSEHMALAKHLSDPDNNASAIASGGSENTHPRLKRQLTLNPANDHRLERLSMGHQKSVPLIGGGQIPPSNPQSTAAIYHQQQQHQQLMQLSAPQQQQHVVHHQYSLGGTKTDLQHHQQVPPPKPLQQSSTQQLASLHQSSFYQHPSFSHSHVTRLSSAPDPIWGGGSSSGTQYQSSQGLPPITRLNSTSDPYLNVYDSTDYNTPYSFDYQQQQRSQRQHASTAIGPRTGSTSTLPIGSRPMSPMPPLHTSLVGSTSAGPIGSRPMSPHQQQQQHSVMQHPSHLAQQSSLPLSSTAFTSQKLSGKEEERNRLYVLLSEIFNAEAVSAAMAKHPNETDPNKICQSIIECSKSPQQTVGVARSPSHHPHQQMVRSHHPVAFTATAPSGGDVEVPHEDSRLRSYLRPQLQQQQQQHQQQYCDATLPTTTHS